MMKLLWAVVCLAAVAHAQSTTGSIFGDVFDTSKAMIPGVAVRAVNVRTGIVHTTTSDAGGAYLFNALPNGEYRIEAEAPGFKKYTSSGIVLDVNRNIRVDVQMDVGVVTESVEVTGAAPAVETRDVQVGGTVESKRVNELPLNGRNVYDLVAILPGVTSSRLPTVHDNDGNTINVNGARARSTTFFLDGGFNNDLWRNTGNAAPNPEAVEQFRLLTSNFSAEFGRSPGAVVNVVTKAGTNDLHGSAYEFLRNSRLNARNFFNPVVDPLRQNQFGASIGGPVWLPKLYDGRNKTFFFFSWQSLLVRQLAFTNNGLTPTEAERRGDFSAAPPAQRPIDPLTNQPFPNGQIPVSRFDPVAVNIINQFVPPPNTPDGRLQAQASRANDQHEYVARGDHHIGTAHRLYGTMFLLRGSGSDPFASSTQVPEYARTNTGLRQNNWVAAEDWIINPSVLNQFRYSFTQRISTIESLVRTSWADWGSEVTLGSQPPRPPQLFITGRWQMGIFGESEFNQRIHGISDTVTATRGAHNVKAGAWLLFTNMIESGTWLGPGQVRFQPQFTRNVLADFMLGRAASFRQNNGNDRNFKSDSYHFFVQDDWRIHRRVTLNLGLRYELNRPFTSHRDELQGFRFNQQSTVIPRAPLGLVFPGDPGIARAITPTDKNDWAPRFGVAVDPFGDGKMAIRAGYGIFYAIGFGNWTSNMQGQPYLVDVTVFGTPDLVQPYANVPGGSPFPYTLDRNNPIFSLPITVSYMNEGFRTPYVQQFNFTVERQLMRDTSVSAAYVGNLSRKLSFQRDLNQPVFGPGATAANINQRRPYRPDLFAQISSMESGSNASYHSMQLSINRRLRGGFTALANYTLGKSIDEISGEISNPTAVELVDANNRRLDRAVSNFDVRHVLNVSWLYETPVLKSLGAIGRHVIGGWQVNGIMRVQSGSPFTVVSGRDTNLDGRNVDRADLAGDPRLPTDRSRSELAARYFDPSAFAIPPNGSVGNAGRNILYGPGQFDLSLSFFKNFPIRDVARLQFRAEMFNFPNWVNLGNPNSTVTSAQFGRILGADTARQVQFALKLLF